MWRPCLLILLLAGCSNPDATPARAYRDPVDRLRVALGVDGVIGHVCFHDSGGISTFIGMTRCYRFGRPKRMRGIWRDAFEGSEFFPGRTGAPGEGEQSGTWLSVEENAAVRTALGQMRGTPRPSLLLLDFIGRQTLYPGRYGHMGLSSDFVVVDRLLSAQILPGPAVPR